MVGGLAERCHWVLETINQTMHDNCWLLFKDLTQCEVIASRLGDTVGVIGAIRKVRGTIGRREGKEVTRWA